MIYTVGSSAELYDALARAQGGDTIQLAGGNYGQLELGSKSGFDVTFDSPVTIVSMNPSAPASFSGMTLSGVDNLTFDSVVFDYTYNASDDRHISPFNINNSKNISITNSIFDGDVAVDRSEIDDGHGFARGLVVANSTDITIEGNEFTTWLRGILVYDSSDISVINNDIHSIRSDGMNFAAVQSVLIEGNHIHDFEAAEGSRDHMDMIQFWTSGTDVPNTDIIIKNNILDIGEGDSTQSIFMRNEMVDTGQAGVEMYYRNVLIEENVILNGHTHGITVGESDGLIIRNNTVLSVDRSDSSYISTPNINLKPDSVSVQLLNNAVGSISGYEGQSTWSLSNNAFIQNSNPDIPGYYWDLFLDSSFHSGRSAGDIVVAPGSMLDNLSAGSSMHRLDANPSTLSPNFDVFSSSTNPSVLIFDASHTYASTGRILPEDASFSWNFGTGVIGSGQVAGHLFERPGTYRVSLTVKSETEGQNTVFADVKVAGADVLTFNSASGQFLQQGFGEEAVVLGSDAASLGTETGMAIKLGGTGVQVELPKETISNFFGSSKFELSMTLRADQPGSSWGEIARVHGSLLVGVQGDGELNVQIFPISGEKVNLSTSGIVVNDGAEHDIIIRLNNYTNTFDVLVDGVVAGSQSVLGGMPEMGSWGLVFGNPWGKQNFDGKISAFDLNAENNGYSVYNGDAAHLIFSGGSSHGEEDTTQPIEPAPEIDTTQPIEPAPEIDTTQPIEPAPEIDTTQPIEPEIDESSLPILDDYIADFASLKPGQLVDDAAVFQGNDGSNGIYLDGSGDYVKLGRLKDFESTERLSFSVDFRKAEASDNDMRLVWNHQKLGVAVEGDDLLVYVAQSDNPFHEAIRLDSLGLDDTEQHSLMVMVDAATDHLQVLLDGEIVLDETQARDIDFVGAGGREWGWMLGTPWGREFHGEITDFRADASADFVPVVDDASLAA